MQSAAGSTTWRLGAGKQLYACRNADAQYFQEMSFLTRREQTLVAAVLLAFVVGLGIKHVRETKAAGSALATEQITH